MQIPLIVLFGFVLIKVFAAPSETYKEDSKNDLSPIIASDKNEIKLKRLPRNVVRDLKKRWPLNTICYRISPQFNTTQRTYILDAMKFFVNNTNLKFVENLVRSDCVTIVPGPPGGGCSSNVGYTGNGQIITLANVEVNTGCFTKGKIAHEYGHTVGLYHQHSAQDRDDHIDIIEENIQPNFLYAFDKRPLGETTSYGLGYDYGSIMHYGAKTASANGGDTIVPYVATQIGQRTRMSDIDIKKLNIMYP